MDTNPQQYLVEWIEHNKKTRTTYYRFNLVSPNEADKIRQQYELLRPSLETVALLSSTVFGLKLHPLDKRRTAKPVAAAIHTSPDVDGKKKYDWDKNLTSERLKKFVGKDSEYVFRKFLRLGWLEGDSGRVAERTNLKDFLGL